MASLFPWMAFFPHRSPYCGGWGCPKILVHKILADFLGSLRCRPLALNSKRVWDIPSNRSGCAAGPWGCRLVGSLGIDQGDVCGKQRMFSEIFGGMIKHEWRSWSEKLGPNFTYGNTSVQGRTHIWWYTRWYKFTCWQYLVINMLPNPPWCRLFCFQGNQSCDCGYIPWRSGTSGHPVR